MLKFWCPATRLTVRGRLLSFLVLVAILFGGVVAPAIAHERGAEFDHAGEVLDIHEGVSTAAHDPAEKSPDMPGQPATHHHCTIALEVIAPALVSALRMDEALPPPAGSRTLASLAQAPPTEPPAA